MAQNIHEINRFPCLFLNIIPFKTSVSKLTRLQYTIIYIFKNNESVYDVQFALPAWIHNEIEYRYQGAFFITMGTKLTSFCILQLVYISLLYFKIVLFKCMHVTHLADNCLLGVKHFEMLSCNTAIFFTTVKSP